MYNPLQGEAPRSIKIDGFTPGRRVWDAIVVVNDKLTHTLLSELADGVHTLRLRRRFGDRIWVAEKTSEKGIQFNRDEIWDWAREAAFADLKANEIRFDPALAPHTITDREDIEAPIREALAASYARATVNFPTDPRKNSYLELTLSGCAYCDGTPAWDVEPGRSAGVIVARRADGEELRIEADGLTWESLADRLSNFVDEWAFEAGVQLTAAADAARRIEQLERELTNLRAARRENLLALSRLGGVSLETIADAAGMSRQAVSKQI